MEFLLSEMETPMDSNLERFMYESAFFCDCLMIEAAEEGSKPKGVIGKLIAMLTEFVKRCKAFISESIKKITGTIDEKIDENIVSIVIKNFDAAIKEAHKKGMKTFKFMDIEAIEKCIFSECKEAKKIINKFNARYIRKGNPKDSEKALVQLNEMLEKYDNELDTLLKTEKIFNIEKARTIAERLKSKKNRYGTIGLLSTFDSVLDEIESEIKYIQQNLDAFSEETGYIQNAKNIQDMINNAMVHIKRNSGKYALSMIAAGVPLMTNLHKLANSTATITKEIDADGKERITDIELEDHTPEKQKEIRDKVDKVANSKTAAVAVAGVNLYMNHKNKKRRKEEIRTKSQLKY